MKNTISPVTRTKAEAQANYNRLSRWYDWLASSEEKYRHLGMQVLDVQSGERVLEIGFGTGTCLRDLAQQVSPKGFVSGIDLSDGMAAVARERLVDAGLSNHVGITLADAVQAPFKGGCFEAIFISFTLELFDTPEIPKVLRQCHRILRSNGRLAVVTMVKTLQPNFPERVYEWFHARMPATVDCRPILAQAALQEADFKITKVISEKMWGLPVEIILTQK